MSYIYVIQYFRATLKCDIIILNNPIDDAIPQKYLPITNEMVLWKKETTKSNALFINLLTKNEKIHLEYQQLKVAFDGSDKDDSESTELRESGNQQFKLKNWNEAMDLFNESLRYATTGSECMGLAYANRSACFFQMQRYDQCLADIELAKKANYPERLMPKLRERKVKCLKLISERSWKPNELVEPSLSLDANEKWPGLANVLEVRSNHESENHIVAKCDIDVGEIVMMEKMFVSATHTKGETFCKTCLKYSHNFIPCADCCDAMFCDENCMAANKIHAMTCTISRIPVYQLTRIIESILIVVNEFASAGALMKFVERALAAPGFDTCKRSSDILTQYHVFLKLNFQSQKLNNSLESIIYWSYRLLFGIAVVKERFRTKREKRFLMHLIVQHHFIMNCNWTIFGAENVATGAEYPDISGICPFKAMLTSACIRNVSVKHCRNQMFVYTVRPIKQGEQLLFENDALARIDKQCDCSKCVPVCNEDDLNRLKTEPDYQFFTQSIVSDYHDPEKRAVLKVKLRDLLNKFGRLSWSAEIEKMTFWFDYCIQQEYLIRSERKF